MSDNQYIPDFEKLFKTFRQLDEDAFQDAVLYFLRRGELASVPGHLFCAKVKALTIDKYRRSKRSGRLAPSEENNLTASEVDNTSDDQPDSLMFDTPLARELLDQCVFPDEVNTWISLLYHHPVNTQKKSTADSRATIEAFWFWATWLAGDEIEPELSALTRLMAEVFASDAESHF